MLTQTLSLEHCDGYERCLRDPSFSSYLNGSTEECYVINLSNNSFSPGDKEIAVFSAEKYFNESLDDKKCQVTQLPTVQDLVSGASSVRSVSSQAALLHPKLRRKPPPLNAAASRVKARSYFGGFRCRCVCSDRNSVAVDEYQSFGEVLRPAKEPVMSTMNVETQCMANQGPKRDTYLSYNDLSIEELLAIRPIKSLEVFRSPLLQRGNKPFQNWEDCLSRTAEVVTPTVTKTNGVYAHSDSDSSSDLFELEDFASSKENPFIIRNMSDSTMPAAYAPSEASIEWSVVTASAADFPITSDIEELRPYKNTTNSRTTSSKEMNQKVTATGDKPRKVSSSFLACNRQNSVTVVVTNEKKAETKTRKSQGLQVNSVLHTVAKLTEAEAARNMQIGITSRSLGQSESLHDPNALNFQSLW